MMVKGFLTTKKIQLFGLTFLGMISFNGLAGNDNVVTRYDSSYFSKFSPQNIEDILEKIPGASAILRSTHNNQDSERGLGAGNDQILINGKRVSGKNNGIAAELTRIHASSVSHIELIRGTVAGLDVQSQGLIINVVLLEDNNTSSTLWNLGLAYISGVEALPIGSLSHTATSGTLKYTLGVEREAQPDHFISQEVFTSLAQELLRISPRNNKTKWHSNNFSAGLDYASSQSSSIRLNGAYKQSEITESNPIHYLYPQLTLEQGRNYYETNNINQDKTEWELGGDFNLQLDHLGQMKVMFISNKENADELVRQKYRLDHQEFTPTFRLNDQAIAKEKVLRTSLNSQLTEQHSLESGLEVAINTVEGEVGFHSFDEIPSLTIESSTIEEVRYQAYLSHNFSFSSSVNMQTSITSEWSEVDLDTRYSSQYGEDPVLDTELTLNRNFQYLKPRFNFRYDYSKNAQIRLNIEKEVSQLDLLDFLPAFNGEEFRLEPSNPHLRPEQTWATKLTYQYNLNSNLGDISLSLFNDKIKDHLTEIPLGDWSGTGNAGSAKRYGFIFESNLRLAALGLENTLISTNYSYTDSEFIDPLSQTKQVIFKTPKNEWSFELNHDAMEWGMAYGFRIFSESDSYLNRLDMVGTYESSIDAEAFIEYNITPALKISLEGSELLLGKEKRRRVRYEQSIAEGSILRYENRRHRYPRLFYLTLRGQF
ncbi:TonB-dependent receptor plug domain-containing protein [Pseudoalteromonas sp. NEC-BIFX-2020_015]|uniref:TonB-dependent receptor plug domain-containing protein n=1 Tax=Pseudoalteromonas sp. NEC-BIFX-2020_015 TaxID=2729544 RepID=UPI00146162E2|nr:TonB-dependent receptor [Pseudoalteromonas sp. NEC-BIFX-2020_015]NMR26827.1 TonB-dependent receptor plug domain-containing protein [Pseudoalteromonas sp. NEC-BIFX-2020_015]